MLFFKESSAYISNIYAKSHVLRTEKSGTTSSSIEDFWQLYIVSSFWKVYCKKFMDVTPVWKAFPWSNFCHICNFKLNSRWTKRGQKVAIASICYILFLNNQTITMVLSARHEKYSVLSQLQVFMNKICIGYANSFSLPKAILVVCHETRFLQSSSLYFSNFRHVSANNTFLSRFRKSLCSSLLRLTGKCFIWIRMIQILIFTSEKKIGDRPTQRGKRTIGHSRTN